jgi:GMP synthase-like glutamine amidotransferase
MGRPVAIFRHFRTEGPAYLGDFLSNHGIPWQLIALDEGAAVPTGSDGFSGMVFMGGPMSVNDDLPWIPPLLALIRDAMGRDVPVLGHCLGSQLMCRALGGVVSQNPLKEIGWRRVDIADTPAARKWFGDAESFEAFHWHGETWSLPAGAELLAESVACPHQAFALGPHLGMQFHIEMTEPYIRSWCEGGRREIESSKSPAVQSVSTILELMPSCLPALNDMAERVYRTWIKGLKT